MSPKNDNRTILYPLRDPDWTSDHRYFREGYPADHDQGMLIAVLISLSALLVNGQIEQNGFRKNRQLDLGLQDIEKTPSTEQTKPENLGTNGLISSLPNTYLPAKFDTAQNQQSFESANVNGKQQELCKGTSDSTLCKGSGNVEKPSQDLVPPFNSLEEDQQGKAKASATAKAQSEDTQTTAVPTTEQELEGTTLKAPEQMQTTSSAESSSPASVIATTTPSSTEFTTTEKVAEKVEASNDQEKNVFSSNKEYLPPVQEISAAAQTNVAVIEPLNQANDHDHHHHHHDENFNVCADAFHSFLCAPLKTRRRITGALPDKFRGSSSFLQYQKVLPNSENQAASSNAVQNGYLPPKTNGFSANQIQSTYASFTSKEPPAYTTTPTTTVRPYSQYNSYTTVRPYSQYNTYTTSRPYSPFSQTSNTYDKNYIPPFPGSSASNPSYFSSATNQIFGSRIPTTPTSSTIKTVDNTFIPGSTFISPQSTYKTINPSIPGISTYKPFSSNENRYYLPPDSKFPAAAFASPVQNYYPSSTSSRPQTSTFGSTETYVPSKYNYVNQKPAPTYQSFGSFNTITSSPAYQTFGSFNTGTSSAKPTYTSSFPTSYKPFSQGVYSTNQPKYQPGSNYISTTVKPFTTIRTNYNFNQAVTNQDKYYLPPDSKEPAAAQVSSSAVAAPQNTNPFHHDRDLCNDPFHSFLCSGPKPRKRITGALPSTYNGESTKTNEQRAPAPSNQNESVIRPDKIAEGAQAQSLGYKYPAPSNPLPTQSPTLPPLSGSTGYSYSKPGKVFPFPSQQDETKITTKEPETSPLSTSEPQPQVANGNESEPDKTSSDDQNTKASTTVAPTTGYSYQRPQKTFPLPTEQKEIRQRPVESPVYRQPASSLSGRGKGYQYSKPEQSFRLPEKKGYSYPKPEKRFELPTESRRKSLPSQTNSNLDPVRNLGSADFIPVNKIDFKRSRPTNLLAAGLRRFGERLKSQDKRV